MSCTPNKGLSAVEKYACRISLYSKYVAILDVNLRFICTSNVQEGKYQNVLNKTLALNFLLRPVCCRSQFST